MMTPKQAIHLDVTLVYLDPIFENKVTSRAHFHTATKLNQLRTMIQGLPQENIKIAVFRHPRTKYIRCIRLKQDIIDELFKFMLYSPSLTSGPQR
jgi:pyridoxine 5'-phosphate synthase PdxJ